MPNKLPIPRIQLGVYMTSGASCTAAVHTALSLGYRAIDSAAWYANEGDVGLGIQQFLASNASVTRKDIFFTTKLRSNTGYSATRAAIRESIRKSGLGWIDLYLLHSPYGGRAKRWDCWRAVQDAVRDGEVRSAGVSNFGVRHLQELMEDSAAAAAAAAAGKRDVPITVNQVEVHPFNTQSAITEFCQAHGIVVEAYAPLVRGMRMKHPTIVRIARECDVTPAQVLVRWGLQKGFVVLPKSVTMERIRENAQVSHFELSEGHMEELEALDEHLVTDWDPTDAE
ncbi:NADP-dependent oxidoreductase domain-containing protein [Sphaerosporella brunnea]|uniref:NADP-dependent oxidoreductase domain-containing protein n=1 Tax=Sphaerosporella brunnea TaxID=1250544 RepID=A0A5J5F3H7_9PEZI|nr:NADP-dependent oxidoreductase domain-containing protein [Sphaerosporella brunnea]